MPDTPRQKPGTDGSVHGTDPRLADSTPGGQGQIRQSPVLPRAAGSGKIVKADQLCRSVWASPARVVRRDVDTARRLAAQITELARTQAAEIVRQAEAQREHVLQAASQQGYEEGLRRWNDILAAAEARSAEMARQHESDLIKLAVKIAEKIIGDRLHADPNTMIQIVSEALKSVRRERSLTIQVHPDCVALVRGKLDELKLRLGGAKEIWVEPNPEVKPGGCIIQSDVGVIDARIDTQLRCMERVLLQAKP